MHDEDVKMREIRSERNRLRAVVRQVGVWSKRSVFLADLPERDRTALGMVVARQSVCREGSLLKETKIRV